MSLADRAWVVERCRRLRTCLLVYAPDQLNDYASERIENAVNNVDAVLDTIGGEVLQRSFKAVRAGGIVVSIVAKPPGDEATRFGMRAAYFIVDVTTARLNALTALFERAF